jgi:hypothetical protein
MIKGRSDPVSAAPAALGFSAARRRTPGLRREEVALRSNIRHPILGSIELEYSAFAVDGRPDLGMIVYNPVTSSDADRIRSLITSKPES